MLINAPHEVLACTVVAETFGGDAARITFVADVDPRNDDECMLVDRVLLAHAYRVAANLIEREECVGLAVSVGQPDRLTLRGDVRTILGRREVFALVLEVEWVDEVEPDMLAAWHAAALEDTTRKGV